MKSGRHKLKHQLLTTGKCDDADFFISGGNAGANLANNIDNGPSSQRWKTTSQTGQNEVVARWGELEDRADIRKNIRDRRRFHTSTNIQFGSDKVPYETDAMSRQKDILGSDPREMSQFRENTKAMKSALTRTNFVLGDGPPEYPRPLLLPDPTGHLDEYTGVLNKDLKKMMKSTTMVFGHEKPEYKSVAQEGMKQGVAGERSSVVEAREEAKRLKKILGTHSFNFGSEPTAYDTNYRNGFCRSTSADRRAAYHRVDPSVKRDLRNSHFELGKDESSWETDEMARQRNITEAYGSIDPVKDQESARQLKRELMKTSYVIGDDQEYL